MKRILTLLSIVAVLTLANSVWAKENAAPDQIDNEIWASIRKNLFKDREIILDQNARVLELSLPERADDAASVPLIAHATSPQTEAHFIKQIWLVVDNNPSPVSGVFGFTQASGIANVETRIRVESFTHVRAIAENNDGNLYMAAKWIKASGGCSVSAGGDSLSTAGLGRIKLKVNRDVEFNAPNKAQIMISHPNISGLAKAHTAGSFPAPHFVKRVQVSYEGGLVMSADVDFSISMNPVFRFYFRPERAGKLSAIVSDSDDLRFEQAITVGK